MGKYEGFILDAVLVVLVICAGLAAFGASLPIH